MVPDNTILFVSADADNDTSTDSVFARLHHVEGGIRSDFVPLKTASAAFWSLYTYSREVLQQQLAVGEWQRLSKMTSIALRDETGDTSSSVRHGEPTTPVGCYTLNRSET